MTMICAFSNTFENRMGFNLFSGGGGGGGQAKDKVYYQL